MVDFLNWVVQNPAPSIIISLFIIACVSKFHIVENNTYNFYKDKEEESDEN